MTKTQIKKLLKAIPDVENFQSSNGNNVPNQFKIYTEKGVFFKSYNTIIAFKSNSGDVLLDTEKWGYSVATSKYRNQFLNESIADTRKKIETGEYQLVDLN